MSYRPGAVHIPMYYPLRFQPYYYPLGYKCYRLGYVCMRTISVQSTYAISCVIVMVRALSSEGVFGNNTRQWQCAFSLQAHASSDPRRTLIVYCKIPPIVATACSTHDILGALNPPHCVWKYAESIVFCHVLPCTSSA